MMELFFLTGWGLFFSVLGFTVWSAMERHFKVYLLIILHFFFLTGIFYLYPLLPTVILNK